MGIKCMKDKKKVVKLIFDEVVFVKLISKIDKIFGGFEKQEMIKCKRQCDSDDVFDLK